jgi:uncharacterized protein (DUF2062 family)
VDPSPEPNSPTKARTFWQRRVRDPIVNQLTQGVTPEKMALTLSVGSALALFPILGTTSLLCLVVGIALRLNQPIIQVVNLLCYPIHIPLIIVMFRFGESLFDVPHVNFSIKYLREMYGLFSDDRNLFFARFGDTVLHAVVAWALLAPAWILAVYFIARPVLRGIQRVKAENAAKTLAAKPPEHPVP